MLTTNLVQNSNNGIWKQRFPVVLGIVANPVSYFVEFNLFKMLQKGYLLRIRRYFQLSQYDDRLAIKPLGSWKRKSQGNNRSRCLPNFNDQNESKESKLNFYNMPKLILSGLILITYRICGIKQQVFKVRPLIRFNVYTHHSTIKMYWADEFSKLMIIFLLYLIKRLACQ